MVLVSKTKRSSIHAKRRTGRHHKRDHHYANTYWPYLPLVLIVALGLAFNAFWAGAMNGVLGYATNTSIAGLLDDTNTQRSSNGLGGLALNGQLSSAAQAKANDMAARNYWSHTTPEGNQPWVFISNAGYSYKTAGENLAYGFDSSSSTVTGWMNSPGHRANILNTSFTEVGFGYADAADYQSSGPQTIVVAMYASPAGAAPAPAPAKPKPTAPVAKATPAPAPAPVAEAVPEPTPPPAEEKNVTAAPAIKDDTITKARPVESSSVSRIQLLTQGNAPWSVLALTLIVTICAGIFILRHGMFWHRALVKGEVFVIKHHLLDIALVAIGVLGFILTRGAGMIH